MMGVAAAGWSALGASALLLGSVTALRLRPSGRMLGLIMGFGAGALIAAIAYELVPAGTQVSVGLFLAFGAGVIVFFLLDRLFTGRTRTANGESIALGALLDGVPESLVLGMGIATGGEVSLAFLAAVFVSNFPEGMGAAMDLADGGRSPAQVNRLWVGLVGVAAIAGPIGYGLVVLLPQLEGQALQSFAAGAVLTMLSSAMVPEAFERGGKVVGLTTSVGFALAALLSVLEG
jgi:ZIP family zinc transporter